MRTKVVNGEAITEEMKDLEVDSREDNNCKEKGRKPLLSEE